MNEPCMQQLKEFDYAEQDDEYIKRGIAADLRTWDLSAIEAQKRALYLIRRRLPELVITSMGSEVFTGIEEMKKRGGGDGTHLDEALARAREHIEFCAVLYLEQARRGKWFVLQAAGGARRWRIQTIMMLENMGVKL